MEEPECHLRVAQNIVQGDVFGQQHEDRCAPTEGNFQLSLQILLGLGPGQAGFHDDHAARSHALLFGPGGGPARRHCCRQERHEVVDEFIWHVGDGGDRPSREVGGQAGFTALQGRGELKDEQLLAIGQNRSETVGLGRIAIQLGGICAQSLVRAMSFSTSRARAALRIRAA